MMNTNMQAVGLWGWLGWFLFAVAALLFYRVWTSDPHTALRRMRDELDKARNTISQLQEIEGRLKERVELLDLELAEEQSTNRRLAQRVNELEATNAAQVEMMQRMEAAQADMLKRLGQHDLTIARLKDYVTKLEAERGRLTEF